MTHRSWDYGKDDCGVISHGRHYVVLRALGVLRASIRGLDMNKSLVYQLRIGLIEFWRGRHIYCAWGLGQSPSDLGKK